MTDVQKTIARIRTKLREDLAAEGLEVVDFLEIPSTTDRMVRIRTLEEALEEFDSDGANSVTGYLVQVRPARRVGADAPAGAVTAANQRIFDVKEPEGLDEFRAAMGIQPGEGGEVDLDAFALETSVAANEPAVHTPDRNAPRPRLDQIYAEKGGLNIPYLEKNARLLMEAGEHALARNIYRAVLQSGERSAMALYGIGRCFEGEGKYDKARANYEESIAYQPTLQAYLALVSVLIRLKKDDYAAEVVERALKTDGLEEKSRFDLHKTAGNCWVRVKNPGKAEKHYLAALELRPEADEVLSNLGTLYLQSNREAEAKRSFQASIAANRRNEKAYVGLGLCLIAENDKRGAHDCFAKALEIELRNPTAIFYLVKCAYETKMYAKATELVERYIEVAPMNTNLLYSLGGLQYLLGRKAAAADTARRILEVKPDHTGARDLLEKTKS